MIKPALYGLVLLYSGFSTHYSQSSTETSLTIAHATLPDVVPLLEKSPLVDGRIHEQEWQDALYLGKLPLPDDQQTMPETHAWIATDTTHIYVAVRSFEPAPDKIKTTVLADEIKGPVWIDDSVEIFLDIYNTGEIVYQLVANTEATLYDSQIVNRQQVPHGWISNAQARVHVGQKHWDIEIAIPMQSMGHVLSRGEVIALNIGRNRYAGEKSQHTSFAGKPFHSTPSFIPLLAHGTISDGKLTLISPKRGPFNDKDHGSWEFQAITGKLDPETITLTFPNKRPQTKIHPQYSDNQRKLSVTFAPRLAPQMNHSQILTNGRVLFDSAYEMQRTSAPQRFATTQNPLFETLLEDYPEGLSKEGIFVWPHEIARDFTQKMIFRTGMEYDVLQTPYENYQQDRAILVGSVGLLKQNPKAIELTAKYNIPWLVYVGLSKALDKGVPYFGPNDARRFKRIWLLDPRATETYLEQFRELVEMHKQFPHIKWVFAGDETWEYMHRTLLLALENKEDYPELMAADREIREKYGFGKYGLPESPSDTNPYRWIATYRWEIDKMMEIARAMRTIIDEEAPEMRLVSWDSMTGHRPYGVHYWGEVFDVVTMQIYPAQGTRDHVGFTTKFYADLSNSKEIWPVPHIGHFPASFTASEVEEILSQMLRGGATGIHLWPGDHINESVRRRGSAISERIGAPERWNVVRHLSTRMARPFRVRQPDPDTAIFYSNTSFQATGAPLTFSQNNQCEWIYTILGPRLRGALRIVDDLGTIKNPEQLKDYRTVYIAYMPIADDAEYQALENYVANGGTLVVCDPTAFRNRSDGSERNTGSIVPPVELERSHSHENIIPRIGASANGNTGINPLPILDKAFRFKTQSGDTLATYRNGEPAVVEVTHGKGKVVFFGSNPSVPNLLRHDSWQQFFHELQARYGATFNHDIWRLRLPATPPLPSSKPEGVCLTDNYFEWSLSSPKAMHNAMIGGSYQLNQVNVSGSEQAGRSIPFSEGKLTNRIRGASAEHQDDPLNHALQCRAANEWSIDFQFNQPVTATHGRMFFSGQIPAGWCEVSVDGKQWTRVGEWESMTNSAHQLSKLEFPITAHEGRWFRLNFQKTTDRGFTLAEVDLWQ